MDEQAGPPNSGLAAFGRGGRFRQGAHLHPLAGRRTIGTFINPLNGIGVSVRNTPWLPPEVGRARIQRPKTLAGKLGTPLNPLSPRANTRMWTQEVLWMVEA